MWSFSFNFFCIFPCWETFTVTAELLCCSRLGGWAEVLDGCVPMLSSGIQQETLECWSTAERKGSTINCQQFALIFLTTIDETFKTNTPVPVWSVICLNTQMFPWQLFQDDLGGTRRTSSGWWDNYGTAEYLSSSRSHSLSSAACYLAAFPWCSYSGCFTAVCLQNSDILGKAKQLFCLHWYIKFQVCKSCSPVWRCNLRETSCHGQKDIAVQICVSSWLHHRDSW